MPLNRRNKGVVYIVTTRLSPEDVVCIQKVVLRYLKNHEFVTNRILRGMTIVNYDQAIFFFGRMLKQKLLKKVGVGRATRYVLNRKRGK